MNGVVGRCDGEMLFSGGNDVAELEQTLGRGEVLQVVVSEVAEIVIVGGRGGRGGQQDLAAVGDGRDASRPMDVDADVALVRRAAPRGSRS